MSMKSICHIQRPTSPFLIKRSPMQQIQYKFLDISVRQNTPPSINLFVGLWNWT